MGPPANEQLLLAAPLSEAAGSLRSPAHSLLSRRSRIAGVRLHLESSLTS